MQLDYVYVLYHYGLISDIPSANPGKIQVNCQYHDDASPSMCVDDNGFKCWACGMRGSLLNLVHTLEYGSSGIFIDDWQSLLLIAKIRSMPHPHVSNEEIIDKKYTHSEQLLFSRLFFESLGYPAWSHLADNPLIKKGYTPQTLMHFGVKINTQSSHPFVSPIYQGSDFVGFVSRRECDKITPKYLYNTGFSASHTVGGEIKKGDVMIVEGYSDLMMAYQNSWDNVVCIFGSSFSKHQASYIKKYAKCVIIATDNDIAGRKASQQIQNFLSDFPLYRLPFPYGKKDVGEMTKDEFNVCLHNVRKISC